MNEILTRRPTIFIPTHKKLETRIAKKNELTNEGFCRKCGMWHKWTVQMLQQHNNPDTEQQDRATRAMNLFLEYKEKHINHCCCEREHRTFIRDNVGGIQYE